MRDEHTGNDEPMREPHAYLVGERVSAGPLHAELVATYYRWFNDLDVGQRYGGFPNPPEPWTMERVQAWFDEAAVDAETVWFTLYERASGVPIGYMNLRDVEYRNGTASCGITIAEPDRRGQGCGSDAIRLLVRYAFDVLGLHNVWLDTYAHNTEALRAYAKAGFREIGRRREAHRSAGRRYDVVLLDCLPSDVSEATSSSCDFRS